MTDADYMRMALAEARLAFDAGEVPIGAVAVRDDVVLARARNRVEEIRSVSAHAEFELLRELERQSGDWRMSDITFYVTKEPCLMCSGMLINARVKRIVFGARDASGGGCGGAVNLSELPGVLWRPEITGGVEESGCVELLRSFFKTARERARLEKMR